MKHSIEFTQDKAVIKNIEHFDPEDILFCGQSFRWQIDAGRYIGVAHGRVICLQQQGDAVSLYPVSQKEYKDIWEDYFDLKRDYAALKRKTTPRIRYLKKAWNMRAACAY